MISAEILASRYALPNIFVAVSIQPLFDNLMFLLSSILQTISGSWEAQQLLMQVFKAIFQIKEFW